MHERQKRKAEIGDILKHISNFALLFAPSTLLFRSSVRTSKPIRRTMAGLYIHIPFCASRCVYCAFFSTTQPARQDVYVDALCQEMQLRKDFLAKSQADPTIHTLYIGGGTPSMLSMDNFRRIAECARQTFPFSLDEFTVEVNPDDVTAELAQGLAQLGVNRISMGAQTFDDGRLRFLHRRHRAAEVAKAVSLFRQAGIGNISIDLMYGFPGETPEQWDHDITAALQLGVEHLSAYCLTYEDGTPLMRLLEQGKVEEVSEETSLGMYERLMERLTEAGYEHYEISNFALPGFRSKHNSSYWTDTPYLGIGAAAHSYNIVSRQWNVSHLDEYIQKINLGQLPTESETIDEATHYNDLVTTALRTREGLALALLQEPFRTYALKNAQSYLATGQLQLSDNHLRLTRKGLFVSDMIMSDLVFV